MPDPGTLRRHKIAGITLADQLEGDSQWSLAGPRSGGKGALSPVFAKSNHIELFESTRKPVKGNVPEELDIVATLCSSGVSVCTQEH
jgi:hypothetical protein